MKNVNKRSYKGQTCLHFNEFEDPQRTYLRDEHGRFVSTKKMKEVTKKKTQAKRFPTLFDDDLG